MNKDDGSWRFIYVGPNGQLIGSLRQTSLLQNALSSTGLGALTGGAGLQPLSAPGTTTGTNQAPGMGQPGQPGRDESRRESRIRWIPSLSRSMAKSWEETSSEWEQD